MDHPNAAGARVERIDGPSAPASAGVVAFAWGGALLFASSLGYFAYSYLVLFGQPVTERAWGLPVAVDTALFSVFALHHSVFARTRLKVRLHTIVGPVLERSLYSWVSSVLLLAVCWFWHPVPGELYRLHGLAMWGGTLAQAAGVALTFFSSRALDVLDLAGVRGTLPARRTKTAMLITSGPFSMVRHPLYFGWALFVFGTPHMTATRAVFAVVSTAYLAIAIPWEERGLINTFGGEYESYKVQVRWKMVPWIY